MTEGEDTRLKLMEQSIDLYGAGLMGYFCSLTRNRQDAEELFDDLWVFVLRKFKEEDIGQLGLLRRKAYQLFVDRWRKKKRDPVVAVEEVPDSPVASGSPEAFSEEEEAAFKERFFAEHPIDVPETHKEALWLYARNGHTFAEIGRLMGKPASTVGDWIAAARIALADYLNANP